MLQFDVPFNEDTWECWKESDSAWDEGPPPVECEMQPDEPAADPVESIREEPLDGPEDDLLLPSFSDMFRQTIAVSAPSDERLCKTPRKKQRFYYFSFFIFGEVHCSLIVQKSATKIRKLTTSRNLAAP